MLHRTTRSCRRARIRRPCAPITTGHRAAGAGRRRPADLGRRAAVPPRARRAVRAASVPRPPLAALPRRHPLEGGGLPAVAAVHDHATGSWTSPRCRAPRPRGRRSSAFEAERADRRATRGSRCLQPDGTADGHDPAGQRPRPRRRREDRLHRPERGLDGDRRGLGVPLHGRHRVPAQHRPGVRGHDHASGPTRRPSSSSPTRRRSTTRSCSSHRRWSSSRSRRRRRPSGCRRCCGRSADKLRGRTLIVRFTLTRRARVQLLGRRKGRTVARTKARMLRPGAIALRLRARPRALAPAAQLPGARARRAGTEPATGDTVPTGGDGDTITDRRRHGRHARGARRGGAVHAGASAVARRRWWSSLALGLIAAGGDRAGAGGSRTASGRGARAAGARRGRRADAADGRRRERRRGLGLPAASAHDRPAGGRRPAARVRPRRGGRQLAFLRYTPRDRLAVRADPARRERATVARSDSRTAAPARVTPQGGGAAARHATAGRPEGRPRQVAARAAARPGRAVPGAPGTRRPDVLGRRRGAGGRAGNRPRGGGRLRPRAAGPAPSSPRSAPRSSARSSHWDGEAWHARADRGAGRRRGAASRSLGDLGDRSGERLAGRPARTRLRGAACRCSSASRTAAPRAGVEREPRRDARSRSASDADRGPRRGRAARRRGAVRSPRRRTACGSTAASSRPPRAARCTPSRCTSTRGAAA